jgi:hypothetical protein
MNTQGNTEQKEETWRHHNTWLQTILQSLSNKNIIFLAQKQVWRPVEHNRRPRYEFMQLCWPDFSQSYQKHMMEKRQPLHKYCLENWISACRKQKLDPCLSPRTSINWMWIKDFNIRPEILKLVQERAENTLELTGIGNDFFNRTQMIQQLTELTTRTTWN